MARYYALSCQACGLRFDLSDGIGDTARPCANGSRGGCHELRIAPCQVDPTVGATIGPVCALLVEGPIPDFDTIDACVPLREGGTVDVRRAGRIVEPSGVGWVEVATRLGASPSRPMGPVAERPIRFGESVGGEYGRQIGALSAIASVSTTVPSGRRRGVTAYLGPNAVLARGSDTGIVVVICKDYNRK